MFRIESVVVYFDVTPLHSPRETENYRKIPLRISSYCCILSFDTCSFIDVYRHFGGIYCINLQVRNGGIPPKVRYSSITLHDVATQETVISQISAARIWKLLSERRVEATLWLTYLRGTNFLLLSTSLFLQISESNSEVLPLSKLLCGRLLGPGQPQLPHSWGYRHGLAPIECKTAVPLEEVRWLTEHLRCDWVVR
jgi:hypothetical protein